jgi:hypothetical protein
MFIWMETFHGYMVKVFGRGSMILPTRVLRCLLLLVELLELVLLQQLILMSRMQMLTSIKQGIRCFTRDEHITFSSIFAVTMDMAMRIVRYSS